MIIYNILLDTLFYIFWKHISSLSIHQLKFTTLYACKLCDIIFDLRIGLKKNKQKKTGDALNENADSFSVDGAFVTTEIFPGYQKSSTVLINTTLWSIIRCNFG